MGSVLTDPLPVVEWVVEGWIGRGSRVVLYGEFGSMKSWLLIHLALCIASGREWAGHRTHPQSVLYIDEEMSERNLRYRARRLAHGLGLTGDVPLQFYSHAGVRFDSQGAQKLMERLNESQFRPSVVIVETLRRVLVGKENEASDISAFWRNVDPLVVQGVTLIVSHHMRKPHLDGPNNPRHMASGSTDILAGGDVGIALSRPKPHTLVLTCVKNRDIDEGHPLTLTVYPGEKDGPFAIERAPDYIDNFGQAMLALCAQHPDLTHKQIYDLHHEAIGVSHVTYWRRMQRVPCTHTRQEPAAALPSRGNTVDAPSVS